MKDAATNGDSDDTSSSESVAAAPAAPAAIFPLSCMRSLAMIVEATGCVLVLSSTWRRRREWQEQILQEFRTFSSQHDEQGPLSGIERFDLITPIASGSRRQDEILRWLNLEDEEEVVNGVVESQETERRRIRVRSWVALDDEDLLDGEKEERRSLLEEHVVRVDCRQGLTIEDAELAITMLMKQKDGEKKSKQN
ncbi:hypothetical protein GUITHDRAFT_115203 [Guillardia theta CCMP2712]|uniref:Uncharacterized protein n=1 Tax=Guillardia theta (strain CCMP2712) TaxID=905079 RepID=L1IS52_GUITC|nr:hypothetical protein GUITHDRAFT_115203 [Guillardia theta CCMP2712]EKX38655.1 hypothetical protein GUITHDRAFT_115203 [Guillardia theta CCMP2712]|eukprot:XP_005825635.1 hypothetical protein GUITHDRAFT_115203 [Guillardia theta CCMP2712]